MKLRYRIFRAYVKSWETVFDEAATFASRMPTDRVASISHSADNSTGIVVVWFFASDEEAQEWLKD